MAFHSAALFISDNVGTQIDGLGHITSGADDHWYNGFRESEYGYDFGVGKADADTIPPIIGRAVLIDVATWKRSMRCRRIIQSPQRICRRRLRRRKWMWNRATSS